MVPFLTNTASLLGVTCKGASTCRGGGEGITGQKDGDSYPKGAMVGGKCVVAGRKGTVTGQKRALHLQPISNENPESAPGIAPNYDYETLSVANIMVVNSRCNSHVDETDFSLADVEPNGTMLDSDDLYSGYDYNAAMDTSAMDDDIHFQQAIKNSMGKRPTVTQNRYWPIQSKSRNAARGH